MRKTPSSMQDCLYLVNELQGVLLCKWDKDKLLFLMLIGVTKNLQTT